MKEHEFKYELWAFNYRCDEPAIWLKLKTDCEPDDLELKYAKRFTHSQLIKIFPAGTSEEEIRGYFRKVHEEKCLKEIAECEHRITYLRGRMGKINELLGDGDGKGDDEKAIRVPEGASRGGGAVHDQQRFDCFRYVPSHDQGV